MIKVQRFAKGEILQEAGQQRLSVYRVHKGLLAIVFSDDTNGKDHNFMFASEGWIMGDLEAIAFEIERKLTIEAIEDLLRSRCCLPSFLGSERPAGGVRKR